MSKAPPPGPTAPDYGTAPERVYIVRESEGTFFSDPWDSSGYYFRRGDEDFLPAVVLYILFATFTITLPFFFFGELMINSH